LKQHLIPGSTLYVSLEPCAHFGKTPPCADLIIARNIKKVVVGCRDPFYEVDGKGIDTLKKAGVEVISGILEKECKELNKRFFTFHKMHRPYIILKWAQTADKKIGYFGNERLQITNEITNRLVHKWRSEEAAIMVGTNTAASDDPQLTNRLWQGSNPVRIIIDKQLRLAASLKVFDGTVRTIVFNTVKHEEGENLIYYQVTDDVNLVHQVVNGLYQMKLLSVIVEGGVQLLQSFIDEDLWDEARVITNESLIVQDGIPAPVITGKLIPEERLREDVVRRYTRL
jgi:diaminohydroxyphosphoribosylaminopyrimidine deaminase/5-amino-6-(5-phosphoribosylamino)uracil reductase